MHKGLALLFIILSLISLARGTEITLYENFAEVARPVTLEGGVFAWRPSDRLAGTLVGDLVWLSGARERLRVWRGSELLIYADGEEARLHYLTRGLTGRLGYRLHLASGAFAAWLRVENGLDEPVEAAGLTFVAGVVPLEGAPVRVEAMALAKRVKDEAPAFTFQGGLGGVFRYRLDRTVTLYPDRTELPFFRGAVKPKLVWRYRGGFVRSSRLRLFRLYRFSAPLNLSPGTVDVFAEGTFIGRSRLARTYEGRPAEVELGVAERARVERRVEVLEESKDRRRYRVTTRVTNEGDEPARVEIEERFNGKGLKLVLPAGERVPMGYRIGFDLAPGASHTYVYEATLVLR